MNNNYTLSSFGRWKLFLSAFFILTALIQTRAQVNTSPPTDQAQSTIVSLDVPDLLANLTEAPDENDPLAKTKAKAITLPLPDGNEANFFVEESLVMDENFMQANPHINTFKVFNEADLSYGRIVVTPTGLRGYISTRNGGYFINPVDNSGTSLHRVYFPSYEESEGSECGFNPTKEELKEHQAIQNAAQFRNLASNGSTKRTYRVAITTTGEFFQDADFGDNDLGMTNTAITSAVANWSTTMELELAVSLTAVVDPAAIYTNPGSDPFDASGGNGVGRELQAAAVIGEHYTTGEYDLGHCLHATPGGGWSGVALISGLCNDSPRPTPTGYSTGGLTKGGGWSGAGTVSSMQRALLHEGGHQFAMTHTFNGSGGSSCSPGNYSANTAYEIGSGTTIMSYRGTCETNQNVPSSGAADNYYHTKSLEQAITFMENIATCSMNSPTGNTAPTIDANPGACGNDFTIPKGTPFRLTGSGTDPDGDDIIYCWEQIDQDGSTQGLVGAAAAANPAAPLYRSFTPFGNTSPTRYFPNLELIKNEEYLSTFEPLSTVARTMHFRLTGRDYNPAGGGVMGDSIEVEVSSSGPFEVTAPNGGGTLTAGNSTTVTWAENGTNTFCSNVNIRMSTDGGNTYPYTLASSTPNDGNQSVTIPSNVLNTSTARIMVECADNECVVFFDISDTDFNIDNPTCTPAEHYICDVSPVSAESGNAALNLNPIVNYSQPTTTIEFNTSGSLDAGINASAPIGNSMSCVEYNFDYPYDSKKFMVDVAGDYEFFLANAHYSFYTPSFSTTALCDNFIGSNTFFDNGGWSYGWPVTITLDACTEYEVVVWTSTGGAQNMLLGSTPAGSSLYLLEDPPGAYSQTYVALNTVTDEIAAESATGDFTSLPAGTYEVYGANYNGSPTWVGNSLSEVQLTNCVLYSANSKPVTVTGGTTPPVISLSGSPSNPEGNSGTTDFDFVLTRTGDPSVAVNYDITIAGSGANPANADDFPAGFFGTISAGLAAGVTSEPIALPVIGDTDIESDEGFTLTLSNVSGASIGTASATGTILNDDGGGGTGCLQTYCAASHTSLNCTAPFEYISNVMFNTIDNPSACADSGPDGYSDYTGISTTINTGATHTITITNGSPVTENQCKVWFDWNGDGDFEDTGEEYSPTGSGTNNTEFWTVDVTVPATASLGSTRMRARVFFTGATPPCGEVSYGEAEDYCITIQSSTPPPEIAITPNSADKAEGSGGGVTGFTFTVNRTGDLTGTSSADWAVTGSGANQADGADFDGGTLPSGAVTFDPSEGVKTVNVNISGDDDVEPDEGFTVTLSNPSNASITTAMADGNIQNDDTGGGCPFQTITCGVSYNGTTVGSASDIPGYSCISWDETGPEVLHQITTTATGDITASLSNLSVDLDIFLLGSDCDPNNCITHGNNSFTAPNIAAGTYYVVVDGFNGVEGSYTLLVESDNCSSGCTPPTITSVDLTQPTCATPTGSIMVNATGSGTLEYGLLSWSPQTSGTTENLLRTWGADANNVWAVGFNGTILKYDGTNWAAQTSNTSQIIFDVWGTDASNVWTVGSENGTILKYDGSNWSPQTSGTTNGLGGIWGLDANNIWASGANGTILKYDGTNWTTQTSGAAVQLNSIWGADANNVWIVGNNGTILKYDGTSWTAQASGTTESLWGIWGTDANNIWAVGLNGTLLKYDGTNWTAQTSGTTETLRGIWGTDANNIWVTGANGTLLRFDGTSWPPFASGSSEELFDAWGTDANNIWTVGLNGTILKYGETWQTSNDFSGLAPGSYDVAVRLQSDPSCVTTYANNPVVIDDAPTAPAITSVDVTQPTCATPTGSITVNATGSGTLEYSVDDGANWGTSNTFSGQGPGSYNVKVRLQSDNTCETTHAGNPVVLNAPTGCGSPCLTTLFAGGTGQDGNMFDITNNGTQALTINSFEINVNEVPGTMVNIEVYYTTTASTYVGNEGTAGNWTQLGTATVTSQGNGNPTPLPIGGLVLALGESKGLYITTDGSVGLAYTAGTSTHDDGTLLIDLDPGIGINYPFDGNNIFSPRQWNGTICYSVGGGGPTAEALDFEGDNDYVDITPFDFYTGDFTVEGWINLDGSGERTLFAVNSDDNAVTYAAVKPDNTVRFFYRNPPAVSGGIEVNSTSTVAGGWHHFAAVFGADNKVRLYIDGTLEATSSGSLLPVSGGTANNMHLGYNSAPQPRYFNGAMDEIRIWDYERSAVEINCQKDFEMTGSETGLVAYYNFNQGSAGQNNAGETTLDDLTSNNHDGTLTNFSLAGTTSNWVAPGAQFGSGCPAEALDFSGTDDYVIMSPSSPAYNNSTFTYEAWIKTSSSDGNRMIVAFGNPTLLRTVEFRVINGQLQFGQYDGSIWQSVTSSAPVNSGNWTHVAVVKDGSSVMLYINGALDNSGTINNNPDVSVMTIGHGWWNGQLANATYDFVGQIDEVRIWNTAKAQSEIDCQKDIELTGSETGLVAYYNFNQGVAFDNNGAVATLDDLTSNNHDGTLTSFALTGLTSNWVVPGPSLTGSPCPSCQPTLNVSGTIASGTYEAQNALTSDGNIPNGSTVELKADNEVLLNANFEVILGGVLDVIMEGCTPFTGEEEVEQQ